MLIFCVQTNWVFPSEFQRSCRNDFDSSHWLWLESGYSAENVTRVESPFFLTWLESSPSQQNRDSSRVIDSGHAITGSCENWKINSCSGSGFYSKFWLLLRQKSQTLRLRYVFTSAIRKTWLFFVKRDKDPLELESFTGLWCNNGKPGPSTLATLRCSSQHHDAYCNAH